MQFLRLRDLFSPPVALTVLVASLIAFAVLVVLIRSGADLSPIKTIATNGSGTGFRTIYNPLGLFAFFLLVVLGIFAITQAIVHLAPHIAQSIGGFSGSSTATPADTAKRQRSLDIELGKVLSVLRAHLTSSETYAASLANAQRRLNSLDEPEQVRVVVKLLVAENERMRRDTAELRAKLESSQAMVQSLKVDLDDAQKEGLLDPLTRVGNRRAFDNAIGVIFPEAAKKGMALSLVMCDIDNFKRINDTFGHGVGDEVLRMFTKVLTENARQGDIVTRYGGEEFAVILPGSNQDGAFAFAERVRRQFEAKRMTLRTTSKSVGQITASFGVAERRDGEEVEYFIERADLKLYEAKKGGRNRVATYSG